MNAAWQQRVDVRRHLSAEPHNSNLRKTVKMDGKTLRKVRKAAVLSLFWTLSANTKHTLEKATRPAFTSI